MRRRFLSVAILAISSVVFSACAADSKPLELFGIPLKEATRAQLRAGLKKSGLQVKREEAEYSSDIYNASAVMQGATDLTVGYVSANDKFAFAEYTFPSFMNTELVGQVIDMVSAKYGKPSSVEGNMGLGPVTATWKMSQGMRISVSRGWPNTGVTLGLYDNQAVAQLKAEIAAANRSETSQRAAKQRSAF